MVALTIFETILYIVSEISIAGFLLFGIIDYTRLRKKIKSMTAPDTNNNDSIS